MREEKWYYVYILASKRNGTLYVGVTNHLNRRASEHDQGTVEGFTKKYNVKLLVYYETFGDITAAIAREKRLKRASRMETRPDRESEPDMEEPVRSRDGTHSATAGNASARRGRLQLMLSSRPSEARAGTQGNGHR